MQISAEVRRTGSRLDVAKVKAAVQKSLDESALLIQTAFQLTVSTWADKPTFEITKTETSRVIRTSNRIYGFINYGTSVRYATMSPDFAAKSQAGFAGAGGGRGGVSFVSRAHPRPGIKARKFDKQIRDKYEQIVSAQFRQIVGAAVRS
jgi:hypothetical protein